MEMKCTNCIHGDITYQIHNYKHSIKHIWCKCIDKEIPIKHYEKMNFCLYHKRKEDR